MILAPSIIDYSGTVMNIHTKCGIFPSDVTVEKAICLMILATRIINFFCAVVNIQIKYGIYPSGVTVRSNL